MFLFLPNADATESLGRTLGGGLVPGHFLALHGDLGAGKSSLARGVARALGVQGPVPSPTYTLVAVYDAAQPPLLHADWYRLDTEEDLEQLGWDELREGRVAVVEWPSQVQEALPVDRLDVWLTETMGDDGRDARHARLEATGPRHQPLVAALQDWQPPAAT